MWLVAAGDGNNNTAAQIAAFVFDYRHPVLDPTRLELRHGCFWRFGRGLDGNENPVPQGASDDFNTSKCKHLSGLNVFHMSLNWSIQVGQGLLHY